MSDILLMTQISAILILILVLSFKAKTYMEDRHREHKDLRTDYTLEYRSGKWVKVVKDVE